MLGIFLKPFQDFPVAFAFVQFLFQGRGTAPANPGRPLAEWKFKINCAVRPSEGPAPFAQAPGKERKTAEPHARTARRLFSQIRCMNSHNGSPLLFFEFI